MKIVCTKHKDLDNRFDSTDITITADNVVTLEEALLIYESFLRACGFSFAHLEAVMEHQDE